MKNRSYLIRRSAIYVVLTLACAMYAQNPDVDPDYGIHRYQGENRQLLMAGKQPDLILFGDSIIEYWNVDKYFPGKNYQNRGVAGETTQLMLRRFQQDVVALRPTRVLLLGGTNDIAAGVDERKVEDNFASLVEQARKANIVVVLSSVLYVHDQGPSVRSDLRPASRITALNRWLREYARKKGLGFADFAAITATGTVLIPSYSDDGVHPNHRGYTAMKQELERVLP